jgi:hypothetical protein
MIFSPCRGQHRRGTRAVRLNRFLPPSSGVCMPSSAAICEERPTCGQASVQVRRPTESLGRNEESRRRGSGIFLGQQFRGVARISHVIELDPNPALQFLRRVGLRVSLPFPGPTHLHGNSREHGCSNQVPRRSQTNLPASKRSPEQRCWCLYETTAGSCPTSCRTRREKQSQANPPPSRHAFRCKLGGLEKN